MSSSIKKCEHCQQWTDGEKAFCSHCGNLLDEKVLSERQALQDHMKKQYLLVKYIRLKGSDNNKFLLVLEKMIQGGQFIISLIVGLITFLLLLMPA